MPTDKFNGLCDNSLLPSDAMRRHRTWSLLVQAMAWCLMAPIHHLRQQWLIISGVFAHLTWGQLHIKCPYLKIIALRFQQHIPGANELTMKVWLSHGKMYLTTEIVSEKITGRGYDLFPSLNTLLIALPQMTAFRPFFCCHDSMISVTFDDSSSLESLRWRHNERDNVSNHQPHDCLLNRLFRRRSKKTSKLRVTDLCVGNSPGTGEFPAQTASNAENVSIWWRHHVNGGMISCHKYRFPVKWQFQVSSSQMCWWINRHTNIVTILITTE